MEQAPTTAGTMPEIRPATPGPGSRPQARYLVLPIEQQQENNTFRSERSPQELELEAIAAAEQQSSGWTTRG